MQEPKQGSHGNAVGNRGEPMDAEKYARLKKAEAEASREEARIEGEMRQAMRQLREEYGCETLEDAQRKLREMKVQQDEWQVKFDRMYAEFSEFMNGRKD